MTNNQKCYKLLTSIVEKDVLQQNSYIKLCSEGMMDVHIDNLFDNRYSLAHNYVQNGDVMADPDCEVFVDWEKEEITCMTYQQDGLGVYQSADNDPKRQQALTSFLATWLTNIASQGYVRRATIKHID